MLGLASSGGGSLGRFREARHRTCLVRIPHRPPLVGLVLRPSVNRKLPGPLRLRGTGFCVSGRRSSRQGCNPARSSLPRMTAGILPCAPVGPASLCSAVENCYRRFCRNPGSLWQSGSVERPQEHRGTMGEAEYRMLNLVSATPPCPSCHASCRRAHLPCLTTGRGVKCGLGRWGRDPGQKKARL